MTTDPTATARLLVRARFPGARAAWLGGSIALGTATATSDLDISVLLDGPPAPYRESVRHDGWPVELFVHTGDSLEHFLGVDRDRRRPNTLRLIARSTILADRDGSGRLLRDRCARELAAGPEPLSERELRSARYALTDLLDDLRGASDPDEQLILASSVWHQAADLLLTGHRHWTGGGKWRQRELADLDRLHGTNYARTLAHSMRSAADGRIRPLIDAATEVLDLFGGALFEGFHQPGPKAGR